MWSWFCFFVDELSDGESEAGLGRRMRTGETQPASALRSNEICVFSSAFQPQSAPWKNIYRPALYTTSKITRLSFDAVHISLWRFASWDFRAFEKPHDSVIRWRSRWLFLTLSSQNVSNCEVIVATKHRALEENPRARITIKSTMENVSFCLLLLKIGTAANTVFVNVTRGGYQTKYDLVIGLHDVIFFFKFKMPFYNDRLLSARSTICSR